MDGLNWLSGRYSVADDSTLYTVPPGSDVGTDLPPVQLPTTDETPQRPHISVTPQKVEKAEKPPADTGWSSKYAKPPEEAAPPPATQSAGWSTKYAEKPPEEEPVPEVGTGEAAGRGALNALTFGAAPALSGMAQAGGEGTHPAAYDIYKTIANAVSSHPDPNVTAAYERGRQAALRDQEAAQEQHPWAYFGGQLAGSLATPGLGAMRAGSMLGRAGAGVLAGGIGGGLYGAGTALGEGQDLSGIGRQALTGAALGAPLGGVLGAAVGPRLIDPNSPGQMAAATAERLGAPLPRGLTSDNPMVTGLTAKLRSVPFAGEKIGARVGETAEAASEHLGDVASNMTGGVEDRATADAIVRPALQSVVDRNKQDINNAYDNLRGLIDLNQHYTMPNTQAELGKVMADRTAAGWDKPEQGLDQFYNLVNGATFNGAHRARVDARGAGNVLVPHPGYNKADYNRLTRAMTKDLRHIVYSAALDPAKRGEAVRAFDAAERQFGQRAEQNDALHKLVNKPGEAAIASLLKAGKEKGGNVALINQLKNSMGQGSPDFQIIGGTLLHELGHNPSTGQFSLAKFMTEWSKVSDKAKQALFEPDHLKDINEIAGLGKHIKGALKETNTSHTANALLLMEIIEKAAELGGGLLSGHLGIGAATAAGSTVGSWLLTHYLASPAKAKAMSAWMRAYRSYMPARRTAFALATRNLGNAIGVQLNPDELTPKQQRAHGGRVWKTRHDRVKAILERHGATL
jgi:hypothetical protein